VEFVVGVHPVEQVVTEQRARVHVVGGDDEGGHTWVFGGANKNPPERSNRGDDVDGDRRGEPDRKRRGGSVVAAATRRHQSPEHDRGVRQPLGCVVEVIAPLASPTAAS
jgi:hypothetical protein